MHLHGRPQRPVDSVAHVAGGSLGLVYAAAEMSASRVRRCRRRAEGKAKRGWERSAGAPLTRWRIRGCSAGVS